MNSSAETLFTVLPKNLALQTFGDCNTIGSEKLPPGESIPVKLAQQLEQIGFDVELENHGGTMNCSREGFSRIRDAQTTADLVLINYGLVDSWQTSIPQLYVPYYPPGKIRKFRRKVLRVVKRRLRSPWIRKILPVGAVVELDEFRENIVAMIQAARLRNSEAVIILWSTVPVRGDDQRNLLIADYNRCLRTLAVEFDCFYFDIQPHLLGRETLYLDNVHLNGEGASFIAEQMIAALRDDVTRKPSQSSVKRAA